MKQDSYFNRNHLIVNADWMKVYVILNKNGIMRNIGVSVIKLDNNLVKNIICWILSKCDCKCNKNCKIDEYLDIKNCSCEKRLFGKLALACENEKLITTETSLNDRKVACEKSDCLIHTISLVITCLLLLVVIFISCCY